MDSGGYNKYLECSINMFPVHQLSIIDFSIKELSQGKTPVMLWSCKEEKILLMPATRLEFIYLHRGQSDYERNGFEDISLPATTDDLLLEKHSGEKCFQCDQPTYSPPRKLLPKDITIDLGA